MWITEAYAQAAGAEGPSLIANLLPFVAIAAIFYFLMIRPQQKRMKEHQTMIDAVRRGDTVVTSGGIVGKVTKVVDEKEIMVEIADNVAVKVMKATLTEVRSKSEPADKAES